MKYMIDKQLPEVNKFHVNYQIVEYLPCKNMIRTKHFIEAAAWMAITRKYM
jgi:hypothetical protein